MPGRPGGCAKSGGTGRRRRESRRRIARADSTTAAAAAADYRTSGAAAAARVRVRGQDGVVLGNGKKRLPVAAARGAGVGDGSWSIAAAVGQASCKATRCMRCYTSRAAGDGHLEGWLGRERVGSSGGAVADRSLRSLAPAMGMQSRPMPMQVVFAVVVVLQQHQQQVHPQGRRRRSWGNGGRRCRRRRTCFIWACLGWNTGSVGRVEGGRFCLVDDTANQPPGLECSPVSRALGKGLEG